MKIFPFLFFLSALALFWSRKQETLEYGKVVYNVEANERAKEVLKSIKSLDAKIFLENLYSDISKLQVQLIFDSRVSKFYPIRNNDLDARGQRSKLAEKAVCPGTYYVNRISSDVYDDNITLGERVLVHSNLDKIHWKITDSTKILKGYKCQKALTTYSVNESKFNVRGFPIEAWFTKDIPVKLGPLDYGNLPGLILELNTVQFDYTVDSVSLNISLEDSIEIPEFLQTVSETEFNARLKKALGRQ